MFSFVGKAAFTGNNSNSTSNMGTNSCVPPEKLLSKARPVIFFIDIADGKEFAFNFFWMLLLKLKELHQNKDALMVSIILYSHNTHSLNIYSTYRICSISDYSQKNKFIEFLSKIRNDVFEPDVFVPIYNADSINVNNLRLFFNQFSYERQSIALNNTDYIEPILDIAERIIFYLPNSWLNSTVVIIDDGLTTQKKKKINDYKMDNFPYMIRLLTSRLDKAKINTLAKDILQYVEPKPIPRVKKKNIGNFLAIQLPVLEGAMYDNE